jgi:hypothetical protein
LRKRVLPGPAAVRSHFFEKSGEKQEKLRMSIV